MQALVAMERLIFILLLISPGVFSGPATINDNQLIGTWASATAQSASITIDSDLTASFVRTLKSGAHHNYTTSGSISNIESVYIINLSNDSALSYKIVLSGWVNNNQKMLFGTMYLYENGELFNGIPVSFKPKRN